MSARASCRFLRISSGFLRLVGRFERIKDVCGKVFGISWKFGFGVMSFLVGATGFHGIAPLSLLRGRRLR